MKRDDLFEILEPPAGGLAGLRDRLDARRSVVRRLVPVAAALAVAAVVLILVGRPRPPDLAAAVSERADVSAVGLGLARLPAAAVSLSEDAQRATALAVVPTSNEKVAFYWVSSTAWAER